MSRIVNIELPPTELTTLKALDLVTFDGIAITQFSTLGNASVSELTNFIEVDLGTTINLGKVDTPPQKKMSDEKFLDELRTLALKSAKNFYSQEHIAKFGLPRLGNSMRDYDGSNKNILLLSPALLRDVHEHQDNRGNSKRESVPVEDGPVSLSPSSASKYVCKVDFLNAIENASKETDNQNNAEDFLNSIYEGICLSDKKLGMRLWKQRIDFRELEIVGRRVSLKFHNEVVDFVPYKSATQDEEKIQELKEFRKSYAEELTGVWLSNSHRLLLKRDPNSNTTNYAKSMYDLKFSTSETEFDTLSGYWGDLEASDELTMVVLMKRLSEFDMYSTIPKKIDLGNDMIEALAGIDSCLSQDQNKRRVSVSVQVDKIENIDQISQTFDLKLKLRLYWQPTIDDFVKQLSGGNVCNLDWQPPPVQILNASKGELDVVGNVSFRRKNGDIVLCQTLDVSGTFSEPFELENFPFDNQYLNVYLGWHSEAIEIDTGEGLVIFENSESYICGDFRLAPEHSYCYSQTLKVQDEKIEGLTLSIAVQRIWKPYIVRVAVVMGIITLCTLFTSAIDDAGDALGFLVTLLLTAVAYSLVVDSLLPTLPYSTALELYVQQCYFYLASFMIFSTALDAHGSFGMFYYCLTFGWVLWHCVYGLWIKLHVCKVEGAKFRTIS